MNNQDMLSGGNLIYVDGVNSIKVCTAILLAHLKKDGTRRLTIGKSILKVGDRTIVAQENNIVNILRSLPPAELAFNAFEAIEEMETRGEGLENQDVMFGVNSLVLSSIVSEKGKMKLGEFPGAIVYIKNGRLWLGGLKLDVDNIDFGHEAMLGESYKEHRITSTLFGNEMVIPVEEKKDFKIDHMERAAHLILYLPEAIAKFLVSRFRNVEGNTRKEIGIDVIGIIRLCRPYFPFLKLLLEFHSKTRERQFQGIGTINKSDMLNLLKKYDINAGSRLFQEAGGPAQLPGIALTTTTIETNIKGVNSEAEIRYRLHFKDWPKEVKLINPVYLRDIRDISFGIQPVAIQVSDEEKWYDA